MTVSSVVQSVVSSVVRGAVVSGEDIIPNFGLLDQLLFKSITPTSSGVIVDEKVGGTPRNGQAEQSFCGTFDGTDDVITIPNNSALDVEYVTVSCFVKYAANDGGLIGRYAPAAAGGYRLVQAPAFYITVVTDGTGFAQVTDNIARTPGQVYHVSGTYDGTTVRLYVDGVQTASAGCTGAIVDSGDYASIGFDEGGLGYLSGSIWDARIYDGALIADEVLYLATVGASGTNPGDTNLVAHYKISEGAGTAIHDSVGTNHGTANAITEATFWGTLQDVYHANLADGFTKYTHATSDPIYVPYVSGSPLTPYTPPTGYSKEYDRPAGPFHNGCESLIDLTGGGTSDWAFNDAQTNPEFHRTWTNSGDDFKVDRMLRYSEVLTGSQLAVAQAYVTTKVM